MQTAVPAGTAVFREKWKRTDSRFAAFGGRGELRSPLSPHRNAPSGHSGVAHGLFYDQAILWLDLQNAHAPGSLRSPSDAAPECFFKASRCSGRLIFRFRTDPPSVRRCSARLIRQAETLELQPRSRPPSSHTMAFAPKRSTSSRFATSSGRGELHSPLHPPLPPPGLLPLPCTKRGCFSWWQTAPASLCAFRSYSSPLPLMSTSRPSMSTRTTSPLTSITSPRQSTMSASLPASMEPTRSATPMCSAGQRVMARSAS